MLTRGARFNKVKRKEGIEADPQMPACITPHERFSHTMVWHIELNHYTLIFRVINSDSPKNT